MKSLLYVFVCKGHKPRVVKLPACYCRHHAAACPLCFSLSAWLLATVRFPWLSFVVSPSSQAEGHFRERSLGPGQSQCQDSMPRFNRVKSWSKNQARVQEEATSSSNRPIFLASLVLTSRVPRINPVWWPRWSPEKNKPFCWLGYCFRNRPKADFWSNGSTIHDTQEQEYRAKIRMPGNVGGIMMGIIVWNTVYLFHRGSHLSIWMCANLGTCFSPHTCFQSYQEIPLTNNCNEKKKGENQRQMKVEKSFY